MENGDSNQASIELLPDSKLEQSINRNKRNFELVASRLPERGQLIKETIRNLEQEKERRERSRRTEDDRGCEMPTQSQSVQDITYLCIEEESNTKRKRLVDIDQNKPLDSQVDGEPLLLVTTKAAGDKPLSAMENSSNSQSNIEFGDKPQPGMQNGDSKRTISEFMTDLELQQSISRHKKIYKMMASRLPDRGQKIEDMIKSLEQEKECRERSSQKVMDDSRGKIPAQSQSLTVPEESKTKRTRLPDIDRKKLLDSEVDGEPPLFVATKAAGDKPQSAMENSNNSQPNVEFDDKPQLGMQNGDSNQTKLEFTTDVEIEESIGQHKRNYEMMTSRLPNGGQKIKDMGLEQEKECQERSLRKVMDDNRGKIPAQSQSLTVQAEESDKKRTRLLDIDRNKPLDSQVDGGPPPLVATNAAGEKPQLGMEDSSNSPPHIEFGDKTQPGMQNGDSNWTKLEFMTDLELEESLSPDKRNYEVLASGLPDRGQKIKDTIKSLEQEKDCRERSLRKDDSGGELPTQSQSSSVQEESNKKRKRLLDIDATKLLNSQEDGEPLSLVVSTASADKPQLITETSNHNRANIEFGDKPQLGMENRDSSRSNLEFLTDLKLEQSIARHKQTFEAMANRLPDRGKKIMDTIKRLEQEKERRERSCLTVEDNRRGEILIQSQSSSVQEESDKRKRLLDINRNKLLNSQEDGGLLLLVATKAAADKPQATIELGDHNRANIEFRDKPQLVMENGDDNLANLEFLTDLKLEQSIARHKQIFETIANRFPERGRKIMYTIKRLEQEKELLERNRGMAKDNSRGEMLIQSQSSSVQEESDNKRKSQLDIDRNTLLNSREDGEPLSLVATKAADKPQLTIETSNHNRANIEFGSKPQVGMENGDNHRANLEFLTDLKLEQSIARHKQIFVTMANRFPDRGQEIMYTIRSLEQEKELLERNRGMAKDICRGEMLTQSQSSIIQEEIDNKRKRLLVIDRNKLMNSQEDGDPLSLVATKAAATDKPQLVMENRDDNWENLEFLTDLKLEQSIARHKHIFEAMANRFPDRGQKIMDKIKSLEREKELLERNRGMVKDDSSGKMPTQSQSSSAKGESVLTNAYCFEPLNS